MKNNLDISLVQTSLFWEDVDANLKMLEDKVLANQKPSDIILLPETFTTGFSMKKYMAHDPGPVVEWMKKLAAEKNACLGGSVFALEHNKAFNRFYWVTPEGEVSFYNKRHLFSLTKENEIFHPGSTHCIVEYKGWKIALMVCFDLRFPVWMRRTTSHDYDLLLLVANWPERRSYAWNQLLLARAIENQSYVAAVNRVGVDGNGILHAGESMVINPMGKVIANGKSFHDAVVNAEIHHDFLEDVRHNLPFFNDRDIFSI